MPTLVTRGAASVRGFGFAGTTPVLPDPYFNYTTLLLHGNGTNGGQNNTFLDSGTANSGSGFTITRNGNTTQGTFSPFSQTGWSNYFGSGGASYLIANATDTSKFAFGTGDFTIEFWVYAEALTAPSGLVTFYDQRAASTDGVCPTIYYYSDQLLVLVQSTNVIYGSSLSLNQWTHIALSRVSGNSRLFVNGVQTGSTYSDSNNYVAPSSDIRIFANAYGGSRSPTGYCSNFRVVKGTGLYSANFTPPTSPLTAITNTQLLTCQSNRFVDNSSNALTVTPYNTYSVQAFSPFAPTAAYDASTVGGSGYFDGSGDVLNFGYSSQLAVGSNDFTIEAWIYKPGSYGAAETIFGQRANNSEKTAIFFFLQNGKLTYSLSADGSSWVFDLDFQSASPVPLNAWTHVAVSRSGSTWRMFINGEVVSTKTYSGSGVTSTTPFTSGGTADNTYYFFNGYISGLRYVVGSAVYTAAFTPPTAPLTAITNTQLLLNFTNAAIIDNTAKNVLETVGNAQISTTQSKFGGSSIYLDGSDVITIPNSEGFQIRSGNFTIEFWYYPETLSVNNAHILDFGDGITGGQNSWNVGFFGSFNPSAIGFLYTYDGSSENKIQDPNVLSTGQWYHIAVVINGTSLVLYKNGVSVASATLSGAIATSNRPFVMGSNQSLSSGYANGYIDDLRITKGIARYTSNFTPQTSQWQDQ